ncbi:hypothetical protein BB560_005455 [Smittium megazygosporum]|uniref:Uncharacterized protein n=1 Tax=Smittium megazygosporum TaxID=133381 RepID=A0A2T9Z591_9FUNG|nr:hypothetical protein BB560_005455 [Smittium megazygosporum]
MFTKSKNFLESNTCETSLSEHISPKKSFKTSFFQKTLLNRNSTRRSAFRTLVNSPAIHIDSKANNSQTGKFGISDALSSPPNLRKRPSVFLEDIDVKSTSINGENHGPPVLGLKGKNSVFRDDYCSDSSLDLSELISHRPLSEKNTKTANLNLVSTTCAKSENKGSSGLSSKTEPEGRSSKVVILSSDEETATSFNINKSEQPISSSCSNVFGGTINDINVDDLSPLEDFVDIREDYNNQMYINQFKKTTRAKRKPRVNPFAKAQAGNTEKTDKPSSSFYKRRDTANQLEWEGMGSKRYN